MAKFLLDPEALIVSSPWIVATNSLPRPFWCQKEIHGKVVTQMTITGAILTGNTREHVSPLPNTTAVLNTEMIPAFLRLKKKAFQAGFDLQIVSSFRDFISQLRIWNAKALGQRPLLDTQGKPLDFLSLSEEAVVLAILRWSALPGASRHHWGTDIDVIDARALPPGYSVQLTPQEVEAGGIFAPLHEWLDAHMAEEGFFRPYSADLGGVSPERWHLSYHPIAQKYFDAYTFEVLDTLIRTVEIEKKHLLLAQLPAIYERYVRNITLP